MRLCRDSFIHPAGRSESKTAEVYLEKHLAVASRRMLILDMGGREKWLMDTYGKLLDPPQKFSLSFYALNQEALQLSTQEQTGASI